MKNILHTYIRLAEGLSERVGTGVSWLTTVLVAVVCYDVFTRYFLRNSIVAVQELEWHLFALIFLIGAAYTLKHDKHPRVDVFYVRLSRKSQAWIDFCGSLLFLVPFCIVGAWSAQTFVKSSFLIGETSPDPGGLPARFILKTAIPVGFILVLIQGLATGAKALLVVLGEDDAQGAAEGPAP